MSFFNHYLPFLLVAALLLPSPVRGQAVPTIATPDRVRGTIPLPFAQMPGPDDGTNEFWNGSFGLPGLDGIVNALTNDADGTLYAGGEFIYAGGIRANHIARWTGTNWSGLGNGNINGIGGRVEAIVASGGKVYVGGEFGSAGGKPVRNIAMWDKTTGEWSDLGGGVGGLRLSTVTSMTMVNGQLYVAGRFVAAGTTVAVNVARWTGSRWEPLGSGVNNPVSAIIPDGDSLFVGGAFTRAGRKQTLFVAVWKVPPTSAPERPTAGSLFNLGQNVPNPADDATSIPFSFSGSRLPVRLTLVDIHGVVVGELMDRVMEPGSYRVEVETGALPSGTYFYRLSCAGQTVVKPMTVRR